MAICRYCGKEKKYAASCVKTIDNQIPFGDEYRLNTDFSRLEVRCPDCGVKPGGYHHMNCEFQECSKCHGQLLSCECVREPET
jgi:hypothetical protein